MQKITSVAGLKNAIQLLEAEQEIKGQQLKEQLLFTYESFSPINILKRSLKEIYSTSDLLENISGTTFGVASGVLLNKLFVGKSGNIIRKLLGSFLQFGLTKVVSQNAELLKAIGQVLYSHLFSKRIKKRDIPDQ